MALARNLSHSLTVATLLLLSSGLHADEAPTYNLRGEGSSVGLAIECKCSLRTFDYEVWRTSADGKNEIRRRSPFSIEDKSFERFIYKIHQEDGGQPVDMSVHVLQSIYHNTARLQGEIIERSDETSKLEGVRFRMKRQGARAEGHWTFQKLGSPATSEQFAAMSEWDTNHDSRLYYPDAALTVGQSVPLAREQLALLAEFPSEHTQHASGTASLEKVQRFNGHRIATIRLQGRFTIDQRLLDPSVIDGATTFTFTEVILRDLDLALDLEAKSLTRIDSKVLSLEEGTEPVLRETHSKYAAHTTQSILKDDDALARAGR